MLDLYAHVSRMLQVFASSLHVVQAIRLQLRGGFVWRYSTQSLRRPGVQSQCVCSFARPGEAVKGPFSVVENRAKVW